ncbi:MAG: glycosyltransferase family 39 protein [Anaerolineae bacterium]|jgi:mannosyltransferase
MHRFYGHNGGQVTEDPKVWRQRAAWLIILMGGFALRLYELGAQSLWYDETVSAYLASKSIPELIAHTAGDIHPPGYYLLLHLWTRLAGSSEFALAFFSLFFGVLLIPLTYTLARRLMGRTVALWSALLVAISPYNLWYSQEVRMYTLAAALGLVALWCTLEITNQRISKMTKQRYIVGYVLAAAMGLYVLYYFGFLLVALNPLIVGYLLWKRQSRTLRTWLLAQVAVLVLYLPWLPIAWRQATNPPVPPWRGLIPLHSVALEAWTTLSLGQSVQPVQVWPVLVVTGVLFLLGLQSQISKSPISNLQSPTLLVVYTFGPLGLIYLASLIVPLYHVRYLFTYAPPFYFLLGAGLAWLTRRTRPLAALAALALLAGSAFSIRELYTNPRYAADDFRAAVHFIQERWRPGDAVLINAGYAYTGFLYYYHGPIAGRVRLSEYQPADNPGSTAPDRPLLLLTGSIGGDANLGWRSPDSDFYATTQAETAAALRRLTQTFPRIWMLRIYDTVSDPDGFIREWLAANTTPFEDQLFEGEAFMRVQGFMSTSQPPPPQDMEVTLEGGITLLGWQVKPATPTGAQAAQALDVVLWWQANGSLTTNYAASLKLWGTQGQGAKAREHLAAQQDEWPVGSLLFTSAWPPGKPIRHPMRLRLPADLPPGQYWLNVEMYDPATVQPLARHDGQGSSITLGTVSQAPSQ